MKIVKICTLLALLLAAGIKASAGDFNSLCSTGQSLASLKAGQNLPKEYHVQIALNGGYAFRTARYASGLSGDYKDYLRKLSRGPVYGGSVRFNVKSGFSLGLRFDRFMGSNSGYFYTYDEYGNYYEGRVSNKNYITFVGASIGFLSACSRDGRHMLCAEGLIGYMGYLDDGEEFGYKYKMKGGTLGLGYAFGYDYRLAKHIAIGVEASYYLGALSRVTYVDENYMEEVDLGDSKEGLQRFNLLAGIRFYL